MKAYPGASDVLTTEKGLEVAHKFGSTKEKLDLPPNSIHNFYHLDKVNYAIVTMGTRFTRARIEEAFLDPTHGIQHACDTC